MGGVAQASSLEKHSSLISLAIVCMPTLASGAQYAFNSLKPYAKECSNSLSENLEKASENLKKAAFVSAQITLKGFYSGASVAGRGIVRLDEGIQTVIDYGTKKISQSSYSSVLKDGSPHLLIGAGFAGAIGYLYKDSFKGMSTVSKYGLLTGIALSQAFYSNYCVKKDELLDSSILQIERIASRNAIIRENEEKKAFNEQFANSPEGKKCEKLRDVPFLYDGLKNFYFWLNKDKKSNKKTEIKPKNLKAAKDSSLLVGPGVMGLTALSFSGFGYSKKIALIAGLCVADQMEDVFKKHDLMKNKHSCLLKHDKVNVPFLPVLVNTALMGGLAYGLMTQNKTGQEEGVTLLMGLLTAHSYYRHKTYSYAQAIKGSQS